MKMGFTGTRAGMTEAQKQAFIELLQRLKPNEFHHGDCVGADDQAATLAHGATDQRTETDFHLICHPPADQSLRASNPYASYTHEPKTHFARNRCIVDQTDLLVVCPKDMEWQERGGTWYTHDYAVKKDKQVVIIWPDGRVQECPAAPPRSSWPIPKMPDWPQPQDEGLGEPSLELVLGAIAEHGVSNPTHGVNCACMDTWIRRLRHLTTVSDPTAQRRIDYVIRTALTR